MEPLSNNNNNTPEDILSTIIDNLTLTYSSQDTSTINNATMILNELFLDFPSFFRAVISIIQASSPNISKELKASAILFLKNKITIYIKSTTLLEGDISFISNQILSILLSPLTCTYYESIRDNLNMLLYQIVSSDIFISNSSLTISMLLYLEKMLMNMNNKHNTNKELYYLISKEILAIFTILLNSKNIIKTNINDVLCYLCNCFNYIFEQVKCTLCNNDDCEIITALYEFIYVLIVKIQNVNDVIISHYLQYSIDLVLVVTNENDSVFTMKSSVLKVLIELIHLNKNNNNISLSNTIPHLLENIMKLLEIIITNNSTNINSNICDNISKSYSTLIYYMIQFINKALSSNYIYNSFINNNNNDNNSFICKFILKIIFPLVIFPTPPYASIIKDDNNDDGALYYEYIMDITKEHKLKTPLTAISLLIKTICYNHPDVQQYILNYIHQMLSFSFKAFKTDSFSSKELSSLPSNTFILYVNSIRSNEFITQLNKDRVIVLGFCIIVMLHNELISSQTFAYKYKELFLQNWIQIHYIKVNEIQVLSFIIYEFMIKKLFIQQQDKTSIKRCVIYILNTITSHYNHNNSATSIVEFISIETLKNILNSSNICTDVAMDVIEESFSDIFINYNIYCNNKNYLELISLILTHIKPKLISQNYFEQFLKKVASNLYTELTSNTTNQTSNQQFIYESFTLLTKFLNVKDNKLIRIKTMHNFIKPIIEIINHPDTTIYEDEIISLSYSFMLYTNHIEECAETVLNKIKKCADKHKLFSYDMYKFMTLFLTIDETIELEYLWKRLFFIEKIIHSPLENKYNDIMSSKYQVLLTCKVISMNLPTLPNNTNIFKKLIKYSYEIACSNNINDNTNEYDYDMHFLLFTSVASLCVALFYYNESTLLMLDSDFEMFMNKVKQSVSYNNHIPSPILFQGIILGLCSLLMTIKAVSFIISKGNVNNISELLLFIFELLQRQITFQHKMMLNLTLNNIDCKFENNNYVMTECKGIGNNVLTNEEIEILNKYDIVNYVVDDDDDKDAVLERKELLKHITLTHLKTEQMNENDLYNEAYNENQESERLVELCKFKFNEQNEFKLFKQVITELGNMGYEEQINVFKNNINMNEYNDVIQRQRVKIKYNDREIFLPRRFVKIKRKDNDM